MSTNNDFLADSDSYLTEIERLQKKSRRRGRSGLAPQWGTNLADLWPARQQLSVRLAQDVSADKYELGPVEARSVDVGGKRRVLHRFAWVDQVVVATLARGLSALAEASLPESLHSYRPGRSPSTAVREVQRYLLAHRNGAVLRERGLYVLRRDIKAYGEQIPNDDGSALWPALAGVKEALPTEHRAAIDRLLRQALRPEVIDADRSCSRLKRGTPTGSPLQPLVNNLYLTRIDREMMDIDGGLYLRFGDDILFAHPDAKRAQRASAHLAQRLAAHGLTANADKAADIYWTGCGRSSPTWDKAKGTSDLEFLGYRVGFEGQVALKARRVRLLMEGLRRRWRNTLQAFPNADRARRRRQLCQVTAQVLDPRRPLHDGAIAQLHAVNDREHLKQLDFAIALAVAECISGRRGVRAFRAEPYRQLRCAGLPSLVVARNEGWRAQGDRRGR